MTKPAGQDANATRVPPATAAGDDPFSLAPWLKQMPGMPVMADPVAAMAATTAIGFGIAGQMAGMMLGLMQNATERARVVFDETVDVTAKAVEQAEARPVLTVVPQEPVAKAQEPAAEEKAKVAREKSATPKTVEAKPVRKAPVAKAAKADDLKAISGIGPKLEQVLNGMGIRRYADIAALKAADVARIEAELGFGGRIVRDGWVEQAKALVKGRG
ncbi:NADH:ubiquinone oxidoreductase [Sinorhizobium sp. RAC02]|uniref:NADH:ubiquinone oxidoreductase n=1 Tax=Sinorhizobium sp. RAC02 TaxID=1842534 RepID=UPI00085908E1|nr:NADH:ubiquinone oxidoreductase [Sinorhizobium sp. RAC02]AOF91666.1 helix-hairpin-helix domain protein [Sinorhizobium sp. RAC02]